MKRLTEYFGALKANETHVFYAFENISKQNKEKTSISIDNIGMCTCYVASGTVFIALPNGKVTPIYEGFSFETENGFDLLMSANCRVIALQETWKYRDKGFFSISHCNIESDRVFSKHTYFLAMSWEHSFTYSNDTNMEFLTFVLEGANKNEIIDNEGAKFEIEGKHRILKVII